MDEFSMLYEEWTSCKIRKPEKDFTAKELILLAQIKYPEEGCKEKDEKCLHCECYVDQKREEH